ncbi:Lipase 5 [Blastocladiella emersonii ATCC 22665]|nr:Lipase 5 [Blastocladiella emersonii ATCC 22665]
MSLGLGLRPTAASAPATPTVARFDLLSPTLPSSLAAPVVDRHPYHHQHDVALDRAALHAALVTPPSPVTPPPAYDAAGGGLHAPVPAKPAAMLEPDDAPTEAAASSSASKIGALSAETRAMAAEVAAHHLGRLRGTVASVLVPPRSRGYYEHLLSAASSYEQWSAAAATLDAIDGREAWRADPVSPHYDWELVQDRLASLRAAREAGDLPRLLVLLRTSLSRNLANMGNPLLYAECHVGTKHLIEEYIGEAVKCLELVCDAESDAISPRARTEFFLNSRQAFGRTALLLSGGATLALNHIGVVKALWEAKLLPRIVSGASGGSIIASFVCTHTEDEFERMLNPAYTRLDFFDDPSENGPLHVLNRFLKSGVLFDVETLINTESFNRTRRILNITVSSSTVYEMPRLLNYITAPNVYVWSAVAASCSVPYVFKPAPLLAKDRSGRPVQWNPSGHRWIDGSVESDLPMQKLSELFNVNHFIVCQVNPHVVPFLSKSLAKSGLRSACEAVLSFSRSEFNLRCNQLRELGLLPELLYRVQSIVSQRYMGDITIIPEIGVADYLGILTNPTPKSMIEATLKGERATWPKISIMQNHLQVEMALDEMLYRCRLRSLSTPAATAPPPALALQPVRIAHQSPASAGPLTTTQPSPSAVATLRGLVPAGWGMSAGAPAAAVQQQHHGPKQLRVKSAVHLSGAYLHSQHAHRLPSPPSPPSSHGPSGGGGGARAAGTFSSPSSSASIAGLQHGKLGSAPGAGGSSPGLLTTAAVPADVEGEDEEPLSSSSSPTTSDEDDDADVTPVARRPLPPRHRRRRAPRGGPLSVHRRHSLGSGGGGGGGTSPPHGADDDAAATTDGMDAADEGPPRGSYLYPGGVAESSSEDPDSDSDDGLEVTVRRRVVAPPPPAPAVVAAPVEAPESDSDDDESSPESPMQRANVLFQ